MPQFLDKYCMACHDADAANGRLNLEALAGQDIAGQAEAWEKVVRRLGARQMPPQEEKVRPDETEYAARMAELTEFLNENSAKSPDPGKVPAMRRMTRTEYRNAIRDLLGLEVDVTELLPKDESSHGFDNITVGSLSPTLLNRYLSAAQKISRLAVGGAGGSAQLRVVRVPADRTQEEQVEGLPAGTRGGVLLEHTFPVAGEYEIGIRLTRDRNEEVEGLREPHQVEVLVDGARKAEFTVKPVRDGDHSKVDAGLTARIPLEGGPARVGVTFVRKAGSLMETKRQPYDAAFNMHRHPRRSPAVYQVTISGPFAAQAGGTTPARGRIFARMPTGPEDAPACAEEILRRLLERAYRRAVTAEDLVRPMEFYREGAAAGGFEQGIENALSAVLVSPQFLFRIESDPAGMVPGTVYRLDDVALASRLSFFLWSSLPDDELRAVAAAGKLSEPEMLERQVRRMLADGKASALVTNFASQWLQLRNLDAVSPDLRLFPDFDDNLRQAFRQETEMFIAGIFSADRSVVDLLTADYTFVNERLARHYSIPHVEGSRFRRVALTDGDHRGGLLRQGSILTLTSYANRTSPVIRGNWILDNILGTPTPPPPPDIPALDDAVVDATLPMRQRLAVHREKKSCAVCHNLMDPVGFSLENYDAVGRWRTREGDAGIDSQGGLPDGQRFEGVTGLERGLLERPELFARTVTEKLLVYALGRGVDFRDAPAVRRIVSDAAASRYRFSSIILGVAKSLPFTHRKSS
jgi:Protein of unknown function (DUF1592)/Protein of unknown function (DUF1588)/Protein of unknown function (DUF1587)/Protein of unknown function (DUF1585)/Protein of unknown function (DUF1595)/Planctomycete cytochrome C